VVSDKKLMEKLLQQNWDLVLVNIVADVIISLSPVLPRLLCGDSRLILSGILDVRLPDVEQAIKRAGLTVKNVRAKEEWRCLEVTL
jgi:ribosomal protein L11 methyltransferase